MKHSVMEPKPIDKVLVRQSFEKASAAYNQFTAMQRTIGNRLLVTSIQEQAPMQRILDLGAGTGYLTGLLAERYPRSDVHALDISVGMLQQTRMNVMSESAVRLVCSDAESLAVKVNSMDAVYSNLAFQWCSDLVRTFEESYAALKHGGEFAFATFGPQTLKELKRAWEYADNATHVNEFVSSTVIESALKQAGFNAIEIHSENLVLDYKSPKALMLDLKGMGAHNINTSRKRGLMGVKAYQRMTRAYQNIKTGEDYPATFEAIYVRATKKG